MRRLLGVGLAGVVSAAASPVLGLTTCDLRYDLDGWSIFYKEATGHGTVRCDNGQRAHVRLETRGGGVTFGRSRIVGQGTFSPLADLEEVYGDYANAEAHAGLGTSSGAHVVTKGPVSLTLSGSGTGVDLGFAFGRFTISPDDGRHRDPPEDGAGRDARPEGIDEEPVREPVPPEDGY